METMEGTETQAQDTEVLAENLEGIVELIELCADGYVYTEYQPFF